MGLIPCLFFLFRTSWQIISQYSYGHKITKFRYQNVDFCYDTLKVINLHRQSPISSTMSFPPVLNVVGDDVCSGVPEKSQCMPLWFILTGLLQIPQGSLLGQGFDGYFRLKEGDKKEFSLS